MILVVIKEQVRVRQLAAGHGVVWTLGPVKPYTYFEYGTHLKFKTGF